MAVNHKWLRRTASLTAIVVGALLLWLSPEQVVGVAMLVAGIALEAIGIHLDHA